jgi:deoxyribonuclease-4
MHVSGIQWSAKGEQKHLMLRDSGFDWEGLLRALIAEKVGGIVICESPVMEEDAMFLKKEYLRRGGGKK